MKGNNLLLTALLEKGLLAFMCSVYLGQSLFIIKEHTSKQKQK